MKFNELQKGRIYTDKDGINAYQFKKMRNEQIATFYVCEYNEEKGQPQEVPTQVQQRKLRCY